jgi:hypothetical protein
MANRLPRVAFDVDGVVADFSTGFMGLVNKKFGTNFVRDQWISYWDPILGKSDNPLFTQEQWDYGWEELVKTPFFWANLSAYQDVDFLTLDMEMATFQYNGYFVTRRRDLETHELGDSNAQTRIFLENHGLKNFCSVISSLKKDRIEVLKLIGADAYIDDWGEQFLEAREAGLNAYLIDRPHNQEVDTPFRVKTVHEYVDLALGRRTRAKLFAMPSALGGSPATA